MVNFYEKQNAVSLFVILYETFETHLFLLGRETLSFDENRCYDNFARVTCFGDFGTL